MIGRDTHIFRKIGWGLVLFYLLFVFIGWLNIYSAAYNPQDPDIFSIGQLYGRQGLFIACGLFMAMLILVLNFNIYQNTAWIFYFVSLILLVGVFFFGREINGNKSWYFIGGMAFQPSELAKVGTALMLSAYLSYYKVNLARNFSQLATSVFIFALPMLLILAQPDAGSALVFTSFFLVLYLQKAPNLYFLAALFLIVTFMANVFLDHYQVSPFIPLAVISAVFILWAVYCLIKKKRVTVPILAGVVTLLLFCLIHFVFWENALKDYQRDRIRVAFKLLEDNKGIGFNTYQSEIAVGSGGFWGKGYLQGTQTKGNFVPEQHTDFIFSTIGEEWGFAGSALLVILYTVFLLQIIRIARRQRTNFAMIYGYCVFSIFFFHFLVNIAMAIGLMPVIGIPLPFFSYGGSSLICFTILLFILIKLDAHRMDVLPDKGREEA